MILDVSVYLIVFMITIIMVSIYQKYWHGISFKCGPVIIRANGCVMDCLMGVMSLLPLIVMYGLRYGVGADFFPYVDIYNVLKDTSFSNYWFYHEKGVSIYYVEVFYYLLNIIMPNFVMLQCSVSVIICVLLCLSMRQYSREISYPWVIFIYWATQYIVSLSAIRSSIASCILLLAYISLANGYNKRFIMTVIMATLFHTTSLLCLPLLCFKEFKYNIINKVRNFGVMLFVLLFPMLMSYMFEFITSISVFDRYFVSYSISTEAGDGYKWIFHILPVIIPLVLFCRKEIFSHVDTSIFFKIYLMEIPLRILGLYNPFLPRFARCLQIILVVLLPLVFARIESRQKRLMLEIYFVIWYIFYFVYTASTSSQVLPYAWVF